jgi:glycosyltransferase involved in cell wall biosynthesis
MRIAYIAQCDTSRENGILKKICRFLEFSRTQGHQTAFFSLSNKQGNWDRLNNTLHYSGFYRNKFDLVLQNIYQIRDVLSWKPDVIYLRLNKYLPGLDILLDKYPTIIEINSDDLNEYRFTSSKSMYYYHQLTRSILLTRAKGFLFLTQENANKFSRYNKPSVVIGDSIDLGHYVLPQNVNNPSPRVVFMASHMAEWHGVDKIMTMAAHFPDWNFDFIGLYKKEMNPIRLNNIHLHGHMIETDYKRIIKSADVAVATLALHRIGMNETTPLKVREYLAYGVPVIIGYRDPDFPEKTPYILQLPNREENIISHLVEIKDFVSSWLDKRVEQKDILHLDVSVKELKRLQFIERILQGFQ